MPPREPSGQVRVISVSRACNQCRCACGITSTVGASVYSVEDDESTSPRTPTASRDVVAHQQVEAAARPSGLAAKLPGFSTPLAIATQSVDPKQG